MAQIFVLKTTIHRTTCGHTDGHKCICLLLSHMENMGTVGENSDRTGVSQFTILCAFHKYSTHFGKCHIHSGDENYLRPENVHSVQVSLTFYFIFFFYHFHPSFSSTSPSPFGHGHSCSTSSTSPQ